MAGKGGEDFKPKETQPTGEHPGEKAAHKMLNDSTASLPTTDRGAEKAVNASVEAVQTAGDNAGAHARTLEKNGQNVQEAFNATLTAPKGSLDRLTQHAAILIAKNELPANPSQWTAAHHENLAKLATA